MCSGVEDVKLNREKECNKTVLFRLLALKIDRDAPEQAALHSINTKPLRACNLSGIELSELRQSGSNTADPRREDDCDNEDVPGDAHFKSKSDKLELPLPGIGSANSGRGKLCTRKELPVRLEHERNKVRSSHPTLRGGSEEPNCK